MELSASIKQPNPSVGLGYWPAFWALGGEARPAAANWPSIGELDMMEDVNGLGEHSSTLHCGTDPGGPCDETNGIGSGLQTCPNCQTEYHTYSVIVDRTNTSAEQLRFSLDGRQTFAINQNQVSAAAWQAAVDHGFFAIFDLAIGGAYPDKVCGCTSPSPATTSGAEMSVDWFAVYQTGGGGPAGHSVSPPVKESRQVPHHSPHAGLRQAHGDLPADSFSAAALGSAQVGVATGDTDPGGVAGRQVAQLSNGAYLRYDNIDFGSTGSSQFNARVASGAPSEVSGLVEVVLDRLDNPPAGSFSVANTGGWTNWRTIPAEIARTRGTHTVYLVFKSGVSNPFVSVRWFTFPASAGAG
jgi:hypothetical protein